MSKVGYVILHYKNIKDTIKCIKSLKETASKDSKFVIVDNGSGDGSGKELLNLYKNDKEKKALEAAETEKNPEPVTEEKPEMKSMSIAERARLTENIEDEAELQEESENSDETEE